MKQEYIVITIGIFAITVLIYTSYQILRNNATYKIQMKWLGEDDFDRLERHEYHSIQTPSKSNWFGLRWPNEKHYK